MTTEQLKKNMMRFVNQPVIVIEISHPHYNSKGRTVRVDMMGGKPAMIVKRDDTGEEFAIFNGSHLLFLI